MKTSVVVITLVAIALLAVPAMGGDEAATRIVYEKAIDGAIAQSLQKTSLLASQSANLRMKGHREASKVKFLEAHRDRLVDDMVSLNIEPKDYKVKRFLNDRFSCTCYATWAAR